MGVNLGVQVPCARPGASRSTVYQMSTPIGKARGEGNCGRVTNRGKEACECVRQADTQHFVVGRILTKPARLRTETASQAGPSRRVSQASQSRSRPGGKVNAELVQGKFTFLSGEGWNPVSGSRLEAESRSRVGKPGRRFQQSAEAIVRIRHTPLAAGRAEP